MLLKRSNFFFRLRIRIYKAIWSVCFPNGVARRNGVESTMQLFGARRSLFSIYYVNSIGSFVCVRSSPELLQTNKPIQGKQIKILVVIRTKYSIPTNHYFPSRTMSSNSPIKIGWSRSQFTLIHNRTRAHLPFSRFQSMHARISLSVLCD